MVVLGNRRWLRLVTGWGLLVLGVTGLFLPFLQGILFLFAGLLVLSREYTWARRLLIYLRARFPRVALMLDAASEKVARWFGEGKKQPAPATEFTD